MSGLLLMSLGTFAFVYIYDDSLVLLLLLLLLLLNLFGHLLLQEERFYPVVS